MIDEEGGRSSGKPVIALILWVFYNSPPKNQYELPGIFSMKREIEEKLQAMLADKSRNNVIIIEGVSITRISPTKNKK